MNAPLVPAYSTTRSLRSSGKGSTSEDNSSVRAVAIVLGLIVRFLGLLLLIGLFAIAGLAWIWLASFRSGWRLAEWIEDQDDNNQDKLALNLVHNSIVVLITPLAIFGDWLEKLINERFQIQFPPKIELRQIAEKQLGIKLPENSPCLPKKTDPSDAATGTGSPK